MRVPIDQLEAGDNVVGYGVVLSLTVLASDKILVKFDSNTVIKYRDVKYELLVLKAAWAMDTQGAQRLWC